MNSSFGVVVGQPKMMSRFSVDPKFHSGFNSEIETALNEIDR